MGFVASIVMARVLGPNDLGIFHQVQWFAGLVGVVLSFGFTTGISKFTAQFRAEGRPEAAAAVLRWVLAIESIIGGIVSIGLLFLANPIADHYFRPDESKFFVLAFLALTPGLATSILSSALEGAQVFRYQTLQALTVTPLAFFAKIVLLLSGSGLTGLMICNLVVAIANLAFFTWASHREGLWSKPKTTPLEWKKEFTHYSKTVLGIHFVDILVWSRTENYFLGRYCNAAEIAYYNLAQNLLLRFTGIIPNLMWKMLLPLAAEHHGRSDSERSQRTYYDSLRYSAVFIFPIVSLCFLASYELIVIFYGHSYSAAQRSFQILCPAILLSSLAQPGSAAIYAQGRQRFILIYGLILGILNIVLNFIWIPRWGAVGASASYSVTTTLAVTGGFLFNRFGMGLRPPWGSFLRIGICTTFASLLFYFCLRTNLSFFDIFSPIREWLYAHTGKGFDILFGKRSLRLGFSILTSALTYSTLIFFLSKKTALDARIVNLFIGKLPTSWRSPLRRMLIKWMPYAVDPD
jgi:O-antigen/teichoic acid export membrane protein